MARNNTNRFEYKEDISLKSNISKGEQSDKFTDFISCEQEPSINEIKYEPEIQDQNLLTWDMFGNNPTVKTHNKKKKQNQKVVLPVPIVPKELQTVEWEWSIMSNRNTESK